MNETCVFVLANICFTAVSTLPKGELKPLLPPTRPSIPKAPFCSRLCSGGAVRFADEMFPPYRCSCSKSCAVYGDCCYDSPYRSAELWQQYEFVCISVMERRGGYKAISSCPPNHSFHNKCKENLGYMPPVTSTGTNITYSNQYCAWCNRDYSNLKIWNVDLSCPSSKGDHIHDPYERLEYSSNKLWMKNTLRRTKRLCRFKVRNGDFRIIDGLELRSCTTINMISKCSPFSNDLVSAKKCASYKDPVFLYNTVYRNPDCALCNFVNLNYVECVPLHLKTSSGRRKTDDVIRYCLTNYCYFDLGNGVEAPFRNLLTFVTEIWCPEGKRFDRNTNICRKVQKKTF